MRLPTRTLDHSDALILGGHDIFINFLKSAPDVEFINLQWIDYTSTVRVRTVTRKHIQSLIAAGTNVAVCRHSLCLIDKGLPFTLPDASRPVGQLFLLPDFAAVRFHPDTVAGEYAVLFCYFGTTTTLRPDLPTGPGTLNAPLCPRRALLQAIHTASTTLDLTMRVGFELEFTAYETKPNPRRRVEAHASSGQRTLEEFMLPILSRVALRLDEVGVPVEQFHAEAALCAFELVLGHLPPMEAVDGLITAKETTRRECRREGVRMYCFPGMPNVNGLHTNISLHRGDGRDVEEVEEHFLAGVLEHMEALCAFAMPRPESYERTQPGQWCTGRWVSWGTENREGPVRKRSPGLWEIRLPDASAQMYLFVAGVLVAGMEGVRNKTELTVKDCQGK